MLKNQVKPAVCIFDVSMIYSCADLVSKVTPFLPSPPLPSASPSPFAFFVLFSVLFLFYLI